MPIGLEIDSHIATITLGGANELNPLDYPLLYDLDAKYVDIAANPDVRVVILRGAGEKHFCAGYNLKVGLESFKADEDRLNYDTGPFYYRGPPALTQRRLFSGEDASDVLPDDRWEPLFASLLSLLMRKGLIADWEFVDEWNKHKG